MQLESPVVAALNHLLKGEPWARERLAPFAGEIVEVRGPLFPALRFSIGEGGVLDAASPEPKAALVLTLKAEAPAAFLRGEEHFLRAVEVSGNAQLADAAMLLVRHLRWEFEDDLSRLVGDVVAHRIAEGARGLAAWHADAAKRLAQSFADYVTEEKKLVVQRAELDALARDTASLRDGLARLEQRIGRLG